MSAKDIDFTKDDEKRARHGPDVQILEGDHVSCIQCHRLHSRLGRILKSTEMDKDYGLCDEATKQKIMADGTNLFGDDFKKTRHGEDHRKEDCK